MSRLSVLATVAVAVVGLVAAVKVAQKVQRRKTRVERVYKLIDEVNAQDPRDPPVELDYGHRMTAMLAKYDPNASDLVKIACRGQHIARWRLSRADFPEGKAGYLKWRKTLYGIHAGLVRDILVSTGDFSEQEIARVCSLVGKEWDLTKDKEANAVEDCASLTFLQYGFADFMKGKGSDANKMVTIIRKTWKKMSEKGRAEALKFPLAPEQLAIVERALSEEPTSQGAADE